MGIRGQARASPSLDEVSGGMWGGKGGGGGGGDVGWLDFCVCWEGLAWDAGPLDQEHLMGIRGQAWASLSLEVS